MNDHDKKYLENQLSKIYSLINSLEGARQKGSTEYKILYELENINMKLDIPFQD